MPTVSGALGVISLGRRGGWPRGLPYNVADGAIAAKRRASYVSVLIVCMMIAVRAIGAIKTKFSHSRHFL